MLHKCQGMSVFMFNIFNCSAWSSLFSCKNSFCRHLDKLATLNEFSCIKVKERREEPRADCFHLQCHKVKSSTTFPSVIKVSSTSRKRTVAKNLWCAYFSLILLTFHPGKINISNSKNNWQNKNEISIKIFFTTSEWIPDNF